MKSFFNKNKKLLIALLILFLLIAFVGGTIAYFHNTFSTPFEVLSGRFSATYTHYFQNPENWEPGSVMNANLKVENSSTVPIAVRAKVTETWLDSESQVLSNVLEDGEPIVEKAIGCEWVKNGEYYYYYYLSISPEEETTNFINTATFTEKLNDDLRCELQEDGTKLCTIAGEYSTATYSLKINFEVIQATDTAIQEEWDIDIDTVTPVCSVGETYIN